MSTAYDVALDRGLRDIGVALGDRARAAIDGHVRLLLAWTTAINLTAIRDPAAVALGHVIDSLTAFHVIAARPSRRILDLGSGGGFPGIPLAAAVAMEPSGVRVTLLEPVKKKARFLSTVVGAVGLDGRVLVDAHRAEDVARQRPGDPWDVVTARAVASTGDLVELAFPLLAPGGALVAWKRGTLTDELEAARRAVDALGGGTLNVVDVAIEGLEGHRLVIARRSGASPVPPEFPRDPAVRKRRPW
ncbi:MAG TPA: 16S rRNA (guanine(527)-N(7))-methyltransferase RsmG [Candidatus Limnocylindrales bacterium]|nr:16S rRNA (guanine(527)-N(7))-methyltransferase RsmG [Candidatus Limnocylindrales bacterium]